LLSKTTAAPVDNISQLGVLSFISQQTELCQSSTRMNYSVFVACLKVRGTMLIEKNCKLKVEANKKSSIPSD